LTSSKDELFVTTIWNEMACHPVMDEGHSLQIWKVPPNILDKVVHVYYLSSTFPSFLFQSVIFWTYKQNISKTDDNSTVFTTTVSSLKWNPLTECTFTNCII